MKSTFTLLIIFFSWSVFAQDSKTTSKKPRKFQVGILFSPDMAYRAGEPIQPGKDHENGLPKFGYTVGVDFNYNLSKLISLETGLQYTNEGYTTGKTAIDPPIWPETSEYPIAYKDVYNFHYLSIPLNVNFTVGKKPLRFIGSAGVSANISMHATQTEVTTYISVLTPERTSRETKNETTQFNRLNISPMLAAGIDYKINDRMNVRIQPAFSFGTISITPSRSLLWTAGLDMGFYFGM